MKHNMFCFQCEQTAGCTGCTGRAGVCGKQADTANLQDDTCDRRIDLRWRSPLMNRAEQTRFGENQQTDCRWFVYNRHQCQLRRC